MLGEIAMHFFCTLNTIPKISYINFFKPEGPWAHFRRTVDEYILFYITSGRMYLREDQEEHTLEEGDVFFLEPGKQHVGTKEAECSYYYVHFRNLSMFPYDQIGINTSDTMKLRLQIRQKSRNADPGDAMLYDKAFCIIPKHLHLKTLESREHTVRFLEEATRFSGEKVDNYKLLCSSRLLELLLYISELEFEETMGNNDKSSQAMKQIEDLLEWLHREYSRKITGEMIEEAMNINFDYLNRIFRKSQEQTIFQYLNNVRINRAKELLATTQMKIAEVAMETGFSDEFYFSRSFKKATGLSPSIYAKMMIKSL